MRFARFPLAEADKIGGQNLYVFTPQLFNFKNQTPALLVLFTNIEQQGAAWTSRFGG